MSNLETFTPSEAPDEMADVQHRSIERRDKLAEELVAQLAVDEAPDEEPDDVDLMLSDYEPGGDTDLPTLTEDVAKALNIDDLKAADSDQLAVIGKKFILNIPIDTLRGGREERESDTSLTA